MEGELAITSKRGNKIKKNADPSNPAIHIARSGNDVVKRASELTVEEKANGSADTGAEKTKNGNGEKRKHDQTEDDKNGDGVEDEDKKGEPALEENADGKTVKAKGAKNSSNKKQKTDVAQEEGGAEKKNAGRPKKDDTAKQGVKDDSATEKRKAGRPKKADGALPKSKKESTAPPTEGIGSRTRSRQKA
ncbi:hypothetical protein A1O1_04752 [Capronia coronata CBS 617.96]|uniref:Hypervirulence associated protein TUDOR domain-containing protein n=1 Tax=Capronia coronata CBS 617.96 TaxID=1182541 RepID=W9YDS4_9EURO|nr:uncharacterized protein A1O1_04752 [Capronia coronata CBS 617.96]EXJ87825.1 hypothetical protein A1O1_04752 [Capronia coronata CBS 617.96]